MCCRVNDCIFTHVSPYDKFVFKTSDEATKLLLPHLKIQLYDGSPFLPRAMQFVQIIIVFTEMKNDTYARPAKSRPSSGVFLLEFIKLKFSRRLE